MIFGKSACNLPSVEFNVITLEKVLYTKFLGVIIDYRLRWENHIQTVKYKASKAVCAIYRIKDKLDISVLLLINSSLILPHIVYCCEIWETLMMSGYINRKYNKKELLK